jgi:hypothetical protein
VVLAPLVDVETWPDAPFRWKDVAANLYAPSYRDTYLYEDSNVRVVFPPCGDTTFAGHLSATNLKPNFAYQMKLVGKPTALWGEDGDDLTNERLGYAGRWWRVQPNPGNANDADYEAHHNDPGYIYEGYLLFDFFVTDRFGAADVSFALDSSFHVLWWQHQRTPGTCDSPVRWSTVVGDSTDPAYDQTVGPTEIGVYAEIERLCYGETVLPEGPYNCRFFLTEESFHQSGENEGYWLSVMACDTLYFDLGALAGLDLERDRPEPEPARIWPNPSRGETVVELHLKETGPVRVSIFDVRGRRVRILHEGSLEAGTWQQAWDGRDNRGVPVPTGVYLLKVESSGRQDRMSKVFVVR